MQKRLITYLIVMLALLLSAGVAFAQQGQSLLLAQQDQQQDDQQQPGDGQQQPGDDQDGRPSDQPENQIFKVIEDEHADVAILFNRLEVMVGDGDMQNGEQNGEDLFNQLATALVIHGVAEQEIVYPAINDDASDNLGARLAQEHHVVNILLYELLNTPQDSQAWLPKLQALESIVTEHLQTEAANYNVIMEAIGEGDTTELAQQYQDVSDQVMTQIESQGLQAYLEQIICSPILGQQQEFCILTGQPGPQPGGQNGQQQPGDGDQQNGDDQMNGGDQQNGDDQMNGDNQDTVGEEDELGEPAGQGIN